MLKVIRKNLQGRSLQSLVKRKLKFFQCHKGGYGEGNKFLGVDNPNIRAVVKEYSDIELPLIKQLLRSEYHEERLLGLLIMDKQFSKAGKKRSYSPEKMAEIYNLYLQEIPAINNWDLVDLSAPNIIGKYLLNKSDRSILYKLAESKDLWQERIAIIATMTFIRANDFADTLKLAEHFLNHPHDLMHKATGWMLREIGKRDINAEEEFLQKHYHNMPRTALRYAIEKFPEKRRQQYLKGKI